MRELIIPDFYPKQIEFMKSRARYTAYGGARGGGKSFAARSKAILLAIRYGGIQILLLRRTLPELRENHLIPLQKLLNTTSKNKEARIAEYKEVTKEFIFPNGSRIKLGYCDSENDVLQFQGQAYDVIIMEEATHFTEFQFQTLTESNRPSGLMVEPFKPRMYFTCNPGGVGHMWVKRLFITRDYKNSEKEEDYLFIKSLVYENDWLMENDPDYVRTLENLPEERRRAMLDGDWDVFSGQFFEEWDRDVHVVKPFVIPDDWLIYRTLDYGLDMLASYWIAVDFENNFYVFKEVYESNLIVSEAAEMIHKHNKYVDRFGRVRDYDVKMTLGPPDLNNRRQETGKSAVTIFNENGIDIIETNNDRVNGWLTVKEKLRVFEERDIITGDPVKKTKLMIFDTCPNLIRSMSNLQYDEKKTNDASKTPHEITHAPDAIRGFCIYWTYNPVNITPKRYKYVEWTDDMLEDYENGDSTIKERMVDRYGEPRY